MNSIRGILLVVYPILFLIFGILLHLQFSDSDLLDGMGQALLLGSGLLALMPGIIRELHERGSLQKESLRVVHESFQHSLEGIRNVSEAIGILILVGCLIASWSISGILPTLIQLGFLWVGTSLFLVSACIASALVAILSGSSWTTAGTIGIAFMGMGEVLGYHLPLVAGAILSGAYFGDKMSPLSDTTNLASGISRVPLSKHIRFMMPTTLISFVIALGLYLIIGIYMDHHQEWNLGIIEILQRDYPIQFFKVFIPFLVLGSVSLGLPAIPSLGVGALAGFGIAYYEGLDLLTILDVLVVGYHPTTGNSSVDSLLSGGGILSMLPTVFLILSAMVFGGCMEGSGKIIEIIQMLRTRIQSSNQLILRTMYFSYMINATTCDQYLSIVIPGRTLRNVYLDMGIDQRYLSRALEDSGTITSVLIPWNSCGAFMSKTLGVSVGKYFPFCFFHWIQIFLSISLAMLMDNRSKSH